MATERSDKVHDYWRQSSEKFDYFMTGVTGALCAYISQTYQPEKIAFTPNTLELISLLVLVFSVFAGFKRIESVVEALKHNHSCLYLSEQQGQLVKNFNGSDLINESTGEIISPEQVQKRIEAISEVYPDVKNLADSWSTSAGNWYKWRNRLLAYGFLLLIASKVWSAYA